MHRRPEDEIKTLRRKRERERRRKGALNANLSVEVDLLLTPRSASPVCFLSFFIGGLYNQRR